MRNVIFSFVAICLTGCTTVDTNTGNRLRYIVKIDSIAGTVKPRGDNFAVVSGMKDVKDYDLRFMEFANYVSNTLKMMELTQVKEIKDADIVIQLNYGISDPETNVESYNIPVYSGNSFTTSVKNSTGAVVGSLQTSPSNPYAPSGYIPQTTKTTNFKKFIVLTAFDGSKSKTSSQPVMLWETKLFTVGGNSDLRQVFPLMLYGARGSIGKDTRGIISEEVIIDSKDKRLLPILIGPEALLKGLADTPR